jgi:ring-1,2-phenylacetyl-CoA epoxidase subunit PaaD
MSATLTIDDPKLMDALYAVSDPEIPVLSIMDMGVIREVEVNGREVHVKITPTYTGCPAMDVMAIDIKMQLAAAGYTATVSQVLSPPWTTDWLTERGRKALEEYGIAAPLDEQRDKAALLLGERHVKCPNCKSTNTKMVSQFGSTACKALFQCDDCLEPFDYFKCLA